MASNPNPMVHRRRLGTELRRLRDRAGLKIEDVAAELECSVSKISRLETGKGIPKPRDVRDILRFFGVEDDDRWNRLISSAREGQRRGWWTRYADVLPLHFETYLALEADASCLYTYDLNTLHGLLQTPDYAREIIRAVRVQLDEKGIDRFVDLRMARQELVTSGDGRLRLQSIVDEAALRRSIGSPEIMHAQLGKLLDLARLPNVILQVLPMTVWPHPAMSGSFTVVELADDHDQDIVHVEGPAGDQYLENIDAYLAVFRDLGNRALDPRQSTALLRTVRRAYARRNAS